MFETFFFRHNYKIYWKDYDAVFEGMKNFKRIKDFFLNIWIKTVLMTSTVQSEI